jgi:hypothetical protein
MCPGEVSALPIGLTGGRWLFVDLALLVTLLVDVALLVIRFVDVALLVIRFIDVALLVIRFVDVALLVDAFVIRFHFAHRTETDQIVVVVILAKVQIGICAVPLGRLHELSKVT